MPKVWRCPNVKCAAPAHKHGKGVCTAGIGGCDGFICECDDDSDDDSPHGTADAPCPHAVCTHCGWEGEYPVPLFDPKKLTGWAKKAHDAGWRPPTGWKPERNA